MPESDPIELPEPLPGRISKEYILSMPILEYGGPIKLVDSVDSLQECVLSLSKADILGFDTESRPSFRKGESHPVSLIQLADSESVYIIQISKTGFRRELIRLFENPQIIKVGLAAADDIAKLKELRNFCPEGFVDLSDIARSKGIVQTGLRALSVRYLKHRISKTTRTTNWANPDLTKRQLIYAATDAWICLQLYPHVKNDINDYHEESGE